MQRFRTVVGHLSSRRKLTDSGPRLCAGARSDLQPDRSSAASQRSNDLFCQKKGDQNDRRRRVTARAGGSPHADSTNVLPREQIRVRSRPPLLFATNTLLKLRKASCTSIAAISRVFQAAVFPTSVQRPSSVHVDLTTSCQTVQIRTKTGQNSGFDK